MIPIHKLRWIVVLLVLVILVVASLVVVFSSKPGTSVLSARFRPPSQWRVGYHRVDVCQSPNPMMVGWNLNLGPLSVSRLSQWQPSMMGLTNALIIQGTNTPVQTNTILK